MSTVIDETVFGQVREMDEPDDNSFSKSLVDTFYEQGDKTLAELHEAFIQRKSLQKLADLGHFMKGSAAALGVSKLKATCELIQNLGRRKGTGDATEDELFDKIGKLIPQAKVEFAEARDILHSQYGY